MQHRWLSIMGFLPIKTKAELGVCAEISNERFLKYDFPGKDCAFVANWLPGKGLNKLCVVFEVFKF